MPRMIGAGLSRREREIVEILLRRENATAAEVRTDMTHPPSYSAVRSILRILEAKGHAKHSEDGKRYVYSPVVPAQSAGKTAFADLLRTFFGGSLEQAVKALLSDEDSRLPDHELDKLAAIIEEAKAASQRPDTATDAH